MLERIRRIAIIGSTGSIGRQALEIIASDRRRFHACALAAASSADKLIEQARAFRPEFVALAKPPADMASIAAALPDGTRLLTGPSAAEDAVRQSRPDMVLTALVGSAGLAPTLAAIDVKADLAIANKESLVMAGAVVMPTAKKAGINVLPVDSEHSALFQCLLGHRHRDIRRVVITASGGPFRDWPIDRIQSASVQQALNHPTWQMGPKITIDSATLMNKALEIIEAHWLFDVPAEQIDVLIHPESIVHGMVEFRDGSVLAQMGTPSMTTPIGFAMYYPERAAQAWGLLDLAKVGTLHFSAIDPARHPAIALGYDVIRRGGTAGAVLNGANETAVAAFLDGRIAFGQIIPIVRDVLNQAQLTSEIDKDVLLAADALARRRADERVEQLQQSTHPRPARG